MMNEILIRVIVECAVFFELSDEQCVDADAAVQQIEQMASALQGLSVAERTEVVQYIAFLAKEEQGRGRDRYWQCLRDLPEALGLIG